MSHGCVESDVPPLPPPRAARHSPERESYGRTKLQSLKRTPRADALRLTFSSRTGRSYAPFTRRQLRRAARLLRAPLRELSVVLVGDREMIELHRRFMGSRTTTDVLTFPIDEDGRGRAISGEVYVCVAEARRQAKERGIPARHEVLLYALHGMLHLCGFDDRTGSEYQRMHRREDELLTQLGVGRVFDANAATGALRLPAGKKATRKEDRRDAATRGKTE